LPHDEQKWVPMERSWQLQQTSGGLLGVGEALILTRKTFRK
jgi:hypothetical protein